MHKIPLTKGQLAMVDDEWAHLSEWKWMTNSNGYARRNHSIGRKRLYIFMHHAIIGRSLKGLMVDHINGNPLDNRMSNLRFASRRQNGQNRKDQRSGKTKSRFVGVYCPKGCPSQWRAQINIKGQKFVFGPFTTELAAANAYKRVASIAEGEGL